MKKISLKVAGKTYDINIEDRLAKRLLDAIKKDLNIEGNNSVKSLLEAYLKKNYELFLMQKRLDEILKRIEPLD